MTITSAGGRQRERIPEASKFQVSQDASVGPHLKQLETGEEKKGKEKLYFTEAKRKRRRKGWGRGEGEVRKGNRGREKREQGRRGRRGGDYAYSIRASQHFFPSTPFFFLL